MLDFFNINSKLFWEDFEKNYSKLLYYNIRNTFVYYNFNFLKEDIEDCYQEVFLKILSSKETIFKNYNKNKSLFTTYISTICNNKTRDYLKKIKYNIDIDTINVSFEDNSIEDIISVEQILNNNSLTDKEILVIKLYYLKELSSIEISKILNITDSTVRVIKKNALKKIQKDVK
jgi:RNA polymerase sigma factor (sigma-70 family)